MARTKQATPLKRHASDFEDQRNAPATRPTISNDDVTTPASPGLADDAKVTKALAPVTTEKTGLFQLLVCVGGIYVSLYVPFPSPPN